MQSKLAGEQAPITKNSDETDRRTVGTEGQWDAVTKWAK